MLQSMYTCMASIETVYIRCLHCHRPLPGYLETSAVPARPPVDGEGGAKRVHHLYRVYAKPVQAHDTVQLGGNEGNLQTFSLDTRTATCIHHRVSAQV